MASHPAPDCPRIANSLHRRGSAGDLVVLAPGTARDDRSSSDTLSNADLDLSSNRRTNRYSDDHAHRYTNQDTITDTQRHPHANENGYPDSNSYSDADHNALCDLDAIAHGFTTPDGSSALPHARGSITGAFVCRG